MRLLVSGVVLALAVVCAAVALAAATRVTVAREATVSGATIRLGDVAALEGERAEALAALSLGTAPVGGDARTIDGRVILEALRREVGDLDRLTYSIPTAVRVRRAMQEVPESAVRGVVEGFVAETLGEAAADATVRTVEVSGPIRIPAGAWTARVIAPPGMPVVGRTRLQIEFTVDDRPVRSAWVATDVALWASVVVARRPVARGEALAAADLALDRRDLSQVPRGVLTDLAEATGRIARAPLAPFAPIRREQVAAPATVRRGDVVLLVAEHGRLRITAPGEVREDAGLGEQVRVVNRISRKDVVGRVTDASTVVVDF